MSEFACVSGVRTASAAFCRKRRLVESFTHENLRRIRALPCTTVCSPRRIFKRAQAKLRNQGYPKLVGPLYLPPQAYVKNIRVD